MFKRMSLGGKIMSGFLVLVGLTAVAGGVGYWGVQVLGECLHRVGEEEAPLVDMAMEMKCSLMCARNAMEEYKSATATLSTADSESVEGIMTAYRRSLVDFDEYADAILRGRTFDDGMVVEQTDNQALAMLVQQAERVHNEDFQVAAAAMQQGGKSLLDRAADSKTTMEAVEAIFDEVVADASVAEQLISDEVNARVEEAGLTGEGLAILREEVPLADMAMEIKVAIAETRIAMEEFVQTQDLEQLGAVEKEYREKLVAFDNCVTAILHGGEYEGTKIIATDNEKIRAAVQEMDENHAVFQQKGELLMAAHRAAIKQSELVELAMERLDEAGERADAVLGQVEGLAGDEMMEARQEGAASRQLAVTMLIGTVVGSVILGIAIGMVLTRLISKPIKQVITGLSEGATQVSDASGQVSQVSQQLADAASEQAASLEESSSSLEELTAVTESNAANAAQANELVSGAKDRAHESEATMAKLNDAMAGINESSDKISKIIKVIEEVAFQTNLLALNAAVEAARAGEHGKGFAVVAEEVRNLAKRCAESAKETTTLIEETATRVREGVDVAGSASGSLGTIVSDVTTVSDLLAEITKASEEQARGIDQINKAIGMMDQMTQNNAANTEESASAAEELSAQAKTVNEMAEEMASLIDGASKRSRS